MRSLAKLYLSRRIAFNDPAVPPPPPPPPAPVTFTPEQQKKVDDLLAVERRKTAEKYQRDLEEAKKTGSLSQEQFAAKEQEIEDLKKKFMTNEELAADNFKKREAELTGKLKSTTEEAENWKTIFQSNFLQNQILKAAGEAEVFDPDQILEILIGKTKMVPVVDQDTGKAVPGQFAAKVSLVVDNKTLELTPKEALTKMAEMPKYHNQFKSKIKGGLGDNNNNSGGGLDSAEEAVKDPAKWREYRKNAGFEN